MVGTSNLGSWNSHWCELTGMMINKRNHSQNSLISGQWINFLYTYAYNTTGWWFGTWLLFFHILGITIPTDFSIFFRGVGIPGVGIPPTSNHDLYISTSQIRWSLVNFLIIKNQNPRIAWYLWSPILRWFFNEFTNDQLVIFSVNFAIPDHKTPKTNCQILSAYKQRFQIMFFLFLINPKLTTMTMDHIKMFQLFNHSSWSIFLLKP